MRDLNALEVVCFSGSSDWSALYVNGNLETVGDHYLIHEKIEEIFGVKRVDSDDFMMGGNRYEDVAPDLESVESFRKDREAREAVAQTLREQAARLQQKADELLAQGYME